MKPFFFLFVFVEAFYKDKEKKKQPGKFPKKSKME